MTSLVKSLRMIWTILKMEAERSYETPVYTIKFTSETGQEVPVGEWRCISFLSLTSAVDVVRERHGPIALPSVSKPDTSCTVGWVVSGIGLAGCRKSRLNRDSIPGPFSP